MDSITALNRPPRQPAQVAQAKTGATDQMVGSVASPASMRRGVDDARHQHARAPDDQVGGQQWPAPAARCVVRPCREDRPGGHHPDDHPAEHGTRVLGKGLGVEDDDVHQRKSAKDGQRPPQRRLKRHEESRTTSAVSSTPRFRPAGRTQAAWSSGESTASSGPGGAGSTGSSTDGLVRRASASARALASFASARASARASAFASAIFVLADDA
jgi:hypothetical protein